MRSLLLTLPAVLRPRRAFARAAATMRPHAEIVRLAVLVVLAFILAFYLDARDANAHGPSVPGVEASVTPSAPAPRPPASSAR
jgi:hypothetical protein